MLGCVGSAKDEALLSGCPLLVPSKSSLFYLSSPRPNFEVPSCQQTWASAKLPPPCSAPEPRLLDFCACPTSGARYPSPASSEAAIGGSTGGPAWPHPHAGDGATQRSPAAHKGCSAAGHTVPASPRPPSRWPRCAPPPSACICPESRAAPPDGLREEAGSPGSCPCTAPRRASDLLATTIAPFETP